jgi:hypothetical protein
MKDNEEFQKISKARRSDYYQKTKEEQSEKKKVKIDCVCGSLCGKRRYGKTS